MDDIVILNKEKIKELELKKREVLLYRWFLYS